MMLSSRLAYGGYQLLWSGVDWIFPPRCAGCGREHARFCAECLAAVKPIQGRLCVICGGYAPAGGVCRSCAETPPRYAGLRSWAAYTGPLRKALQRLKYKRDLSLGEILARPLLSLVISLNWQVDCVIPAPISLARLRQRGYNQASLIAYPLSLGLNLAYLARGLRKTRETRSQVGLPAAERRLNVAQSFEALPRLVSGRRVLVVDDITTTGATMEACALALKSAGASEVYGVTVARSLLEDAS